MMLLLSRLVRVIAPPRLGKTGVSWSRLASQGGGGLLLDQQDYTEKKG
jgi:hypothetical protein